MKFMRLPLAILLLMAVVSGLQAQEQTEDLDAKYGADLLKVGTMAPDFTLPDSRDSIFHLKNFLGKGYVVLDFWASWCGDCRKDMPAMRKLSEDYFMDGVSFVGVSFDTDKDQWLKGVNELYRLNGIQVSELKKWKETQVSKDYHINWIPTTYLLNPDGTVNLATVSVDKLTRRLAELKASGAFKPYELTMPVFNGGIPALMQFLKATVKYPNACQKAEMQSRVLLGFSVDKDGSISDIHVKKYESLGSKSSKVNKMEPAERQKLEAECQELFEREAIRVVTRMPAWTPGMQGQEKVKVSYALPITFKF